MAGDGSANECNDDVGRVINGACKSVLPVTLGSLGELLQDSGTGEQSNDSYSFQGGIIQINSWS